MRDFRNSFIQWMSDNRLLGLYLLTITAWLFVAAPSVSDSICASCALVANSLPSAFDYFASVFWVAAYCLPLALYRQRGSEKDSTGTIGIHPRYYIFMIIGFIILGLNVPSALEAMVVLWSVLILCALPALTSLSVYYLSDNLLAPACSKKC